MNAFTNALGAAALGFGLLLAAMAVNAAPLPTGACCNTFDGCCPLIFESSPRGIDADCRISTQEECNGITDAWQGEGTTCEEICAPPPTGACCNVFDGCCPLIFESSPRGIDAECRNSTEANCIGAFDSYQGDDTSCAQICSPTTTTTLPEEDEGACCHTFGGCCPPPVELTARGVAGECRIETSAGCNGIADTFKGAGTTCEQFCLITTTTTLPMGACCQPDGGCLDLIEDNCNEGTYQGDGTICTTVECPQPTTTTTLLPETTTTAPDTTTTTFPIPLCGDANANEEITTADAQIALQTAVGTRNCPPERCDYNGVGGITTTDALAILKVAVGSNIPPNCPLL